MTKTKRPYFSFFYVIKRFHKNLQKIRRNTTMVTAVGALLKTDNARKSYVKIFVHWFYVLLLFWKAVSCVENII